jgi:aminotransferase
MREALAKKQSYFMGLDLDPEENVLITVGGTEAMVCAMMALCDPGDKVAVFSPFFENYIAEIIMSGAEPIYIPLVPPTFSFDPERLEDAFRQGAKALILCNPSNPSGKVFTREELQIIADLAIKYDAYVVTDEVYEHIIYEPNKHTYIATLPGMWERTVSCGSLSKTYHITGWRIGYVIAPKHIEDRCKQIHDFTTVGAASPLMEAIVTGLEFPLSYYKDLQNQYQHMKDLFVGGLKNLGIPYSDPQGAYYVMVDIGPYCKNDDIGFCEWMAREVGVAAVPGCTFFKEDVHTMARFHFAKKDETLYEALERLSTLKKKLK